MTSKLYNLTSFSLRPEPAAESILGFLLHFKMMMMMVKMMMRTMKKRKMGSTTTPVQQVENSCGGNHGFSVIGSKGCGLPNHHGSQQECLSAQDTIAIKSYSSHLGHGEDFLVGQELGVDEVAAIEHAATIGKERHRLGEAKNNPAKMTSRP